MISTTNNNTLKQQRCLLHNTSHVHTKHPRSDLSNNEITDRTSVRATMELEPFSVVHSFRLVARTHTNTQAHTHTYSGLDEVIVWARVGVCVHVRV